jgi:short-subunit dehydrogenase
MPLGAAARRFDLSGRVVVTGASKGIGRGLTILLTTQEPSLFQL